MYTVNKPFTNNVSESLRWQTGRIYSRDKSVVNYKKYAKRKTSRTTATTTITTPNIKTPCRWSAPPSASAAGMVDWNASGYMMREHVVSELWASLNLTGYFGEYPDDGRL